MGEEGPAGSVDAVSPATEIDSVEVQLEDLVLGEFALDGERQHGFLDLAPEGAAVGQEDVARELLGDGRSALSPTPRLEAHLERARDADRVDPRVAAEAAILDRDHRRTHRRGDFLIAQPAPEARAERDQQAAVGGAHADHLAKVAALAQRGVIGKRGHGDADRDRQREQAKAGQRKSPADDGAKQAARPRLR
jgi:hypothetical protein